MPLPQACHPPVGPRPYSKEFVDQPAYKCSRTSQLQSNKPGPTGQNKGSWPAPPPPNYTRFSMSYKIYHFWCYGLQHILNRTFIFDFLDCSQSLFPFSIRKTLPSLVSWLALLHWTSFLTIWLDSFFDAWHPKLTVLLCWEWSCRECLEKVDSSLNWSRRWGFFVLTLICTWSFDQIHYWKNPFYPSCWNGNCHHENNYKLHSKKLCW